MDSNELRAACIEAGFEIVDEAGGTWTAVTPKEWGNSFAFSQGNPALPAYVAELLAQRDEITGYDVSEMDLARVPYAYECEVLSSELEKHAGTGDTPAEAIIRAAMAAIAATTEEPT